MDTKIPNWVPFVIVGLILGAFIGWGIAALFDFNQSAGTGWGVLGGGLVTGAWATSASKK